jgi:hypothetical protein
MVLNLHGHVDDRPARDILQRFGPIDGGRIGPPWAAGHLAYFGAERPFASVRVSLSSRLPMTLEIDTWRRWTPDEIAIDDIPTHGADHVHRVFERLGIKLGDSIPRAGSPPILLIGSA